MYTLETGQWAWQVYYCILLWHSSALVVPNVLRTALVVLHVPNVLRLLPDIAFTTVGFEPQVQTGPLSRKPRKALGWDPTLGLINDLWVPRMTFPAASLSRVWVLSFVYLFTPINDHIIRFVIPLIVCRLIERYERLHFGAWKCIAHWFSDLYVYELPNIQPLPRQVTWLIDILSKHQGDT